MKITRFGLFFLFCAGLLWTACKERVNENKDKFYTEKGEWDSSRIPFINPYEAIMTNEDFGWCMNLSGIDGDTGLSNIKKANILEGVILLYCVRSVLHGIDVKQSWYVIIPKKQIEKGFDNYREYILYINKLGITIEPELVDINSIAAYFEDHEVVDWKTIK